MTGMIDKIIALLDTIELEVTTLREKEPEHELLKFASAVLEKTDWSNKLLSEFKKKFTFKSKESWIDTCSTYLIALETANGKRPAEKPTSPEADKPDTNLGLPEGFSGYDGQDVPF